MKIILFILLGCFGIISANAQVTDPLATPTPALIVASERAGLTTYDHAFIRTCTLYTNRTLRLNEKIGASPSGAWTINRTTDYVLPPRLIKKIEIWIADAAKGNIIEGPTICDGGTVMITARSAEMEDVVIKSLRDCEGSSYNDSPSAAFITELVKDYCNFSNL